MHWTQVRSMQHVPLGPCLTVVALAVAHAPVIMQGSRKVLGGRRLVLAPPAPEGTHDRDGDLRAMRGDPGKGESMLACRIAVWPC